MPDLWNIANDDELQAIHQVGDGFVFNTFGNKLHASSCDYVSGMTVMSASGSSRLGLMPRQRWPLAGPVMVHVAPPVGPRQVVVRQVKAMVDGIVRAFQAHGKEATLGEMARRMAQMTGASAAEVRWPSLMPVGSLSPA